MSKIEKIGVIGAGNMGSGIAQKIAQEGIPVVIVDQKPEFVERGLGIIQNTLDEGVARNLFSPEQKARILSRISGTTDMKAVADADLVIEAVFENRDVKSSVFTTLDELCSDRTILATNTSSFYVREFAEKTGRPDRFIGFHYFYHPAKNRLLEVIPHARTSEETLNAALLAARLHGKTAIVVKDAPGFAVNRFFVPFLNEAGRMLQEGMGDIPAIEEAAKRAFKIGMGPFELMNVTGIPIAVHSADTLGRELGPFYETADILRRQMETGKNWDLSGTADESKLEAIMDRFYGVCLGVAAALVDEGVATVEDTDRGAKIGLRWALGPFELMNRIGVDKTFQCVQAICTKYPDFSMPRILEAQKEKNRPFEFTFVDLSVKAGVAWITLNRPEAMNALNEAVFTQLAARFAEARNDPQVTAVVFQGAGKAFVAGADIRYFVKNIQSDNIDRIVDFTRKGHELLLEIEQSPKPTIALLDGLSLGGGSELALACQAIVATPAGSMGFPETGIGIYPGLGGMLRLSRHVGGDLTRYFVFTGKTISASDAFELGVVAELVSPADVDATITRLAAEGVPEKYRPRELPQHFRPQARLFEGENAEKMLRGEIPADVDDELARKAIRILSKKAPIALKTAHEIIAAQVEKPIPEAIEVELARLPEIFSTEDALEGLSSLGRKAPEYKGK